MTDSSAGKENYAVIGKNPLRHGGTDKVTGRALYGADIRLPGMLYGAMLRSSHAHARILSIDTTKAEAYPGVEWIDGGPGIARRIAYLTREQPWPTERSDGLMVFTAEPRLEPHGRTQNADLVTRPEGDQRVPVSDT